MAEVPQAAEEQLVVPVPRNEGEFRKLATELIRNMRKVGQLTSGAQTRVDKIQAKLADDLHPLEERLNALFPVVADYMDAHRQELLEGKSKSIELIEATLGWRFPSKATVATKDGNDVAAVKELRRLNRPETYEIKRVTTYKLLRDKILETPSLIKGAKLTSIELKETLYIQLNRLVELNRMAGGKMVRKSLVPKGKKG